jgi:hypothetical protein
MRIEYTDHIGEYWTLEAAARELGLSKRTVQYRVMRFDVPVLQVGHQQLVKLADLQGVRLYGRLTNEKKTEQTADD